MGTASSCSLPSFAPDQGEQEILGVLKRDPDVLSQGFGRINAVEGINGQIAGTGLDGISGLKLVQESADSIYLLTKQKGLFKTEDGGRVWKRQYVFPVQSSEEDEEARNNDLAADIALNDQILSSDVVIDPTDSNKIYLAGKFNQLGKIYKSEDGGASFREVYSEVENGFGVLGLAINESNPEVMYGALEEGAIIVSKDGGATWARTVSFDDTPVSIETSPFDARRVIVATEGGGIYYSDDDGAVWTEAGVRVRGDDSISRDAVLASDLRRIEQIKPVPASTNTWLAIANQQMYMTTDGINGVWTELALPTQEERYNLLDVVGDPQKGRTKLYASVDSRIFISENEGQSWTANDQIQLSRPIGDVGQILIDENNTEVLYLMLVEDGSTRGRGLFGGL